MYGTAIFTCIMCYIVLFLAIMSDLWSGVRKAKRSGKAKTSFGFRLTAMKMANYYNVAFAAGVIDLLQMVLIYHIKQVGNWNCIPLMPFFTILVCLLLAMIEFHSVWENTRKETQDAVNIELERIAKFLAENKEIKEEILKRLKK